MSLYIVVKLEHYWNMALWDSEQNVGWMEWVVGDR